MDKKEDLIDKFFGKEFYYNKYVRYKEETDILKQKLKIRDRQVAFLQKKVVYLKNHSKNSTSFSYVDKALNRRNKKDERED